jgi:anti-sigma factor RsiW
MRCEDTQNRLTAYALGDLSAAERRQVYAHLRECVACQAALARTDWLAAALMKADAPPVPAGLRERVMGAARTRRRARIAADWNPLKWWRMTTAPLHAAVVIALVMGLTAGLSMGRTMLSGQDRSVASVATADPLDMLSIDSLGVAPDDSLAATYVALASGRDNEGQ